MDQIVKENFSSGIDNIDFIRKKLFLNINLPDYNNTLYGKILFIIFNYLENTYQIYCHENDEILNKIIEYKSEILNMNKEGIVCNYNEFYSYIDSLTDLCFSFCDMNKIDESIDFKFLMEFSKIITGSINNYLKKMNLNEYEFDFRITDNGSVYFYLTITLCRKKCDKTVSFRFHDGYIFNIENIRKINASSN